jgi:hypothetical protein
VSASRRRFTADEIRALFEAADRQLARPHTITIIGGSAAALAGAAVTTTDIDTFDALSLELEAALTHARSETGLDIPCSRSGVADIPYHAEDRCERLPNLTKLDVKILERHDLALSKALRYVDHDVEQLRSVNAVARFDFEVLVTRFRDEMGHAMGDANKHREQFLGLIEELFGEMKRVDAERALRVGKRSEAAQDSE